MHAVVLELEVDGKVAQGDCHVELIEDERVQPVAVVAVAAMLSILYLIFIAHFGRNGIYWDDWTLVPIVDNALRHHVDFSQLWQQHNENRMLFPYLLTAVIGILTKLNALAILYASAAMFVFSFALLLSAYVTIQVPAGWG